MARFDRLIGLVCLLIPMVWNVWIVEGFLSPDGELTNYTKVRIWMFDVVLLAIGLLLIKFGRQGVVNIFLVTASLPTRVSNNPRFYRWVGLVSLLIPMVWNVWIVEGFLSPDGELANTTKAWIWMFDVVLLAIGLLVIKFERQGVVNIFLVTVSLTISLGLFELILRTGYLDNESDPHPVWVPPNLNQIRQDIGQANAIFIHHNPLKFNDIPRSRTKAEGHSRIAVIGDSFIQAWLSHYDEIWSHRLEKRIREHFDNIEVLSWGKSGWSTLDEFRFLQELGIHYEIDLLIVGFTVNDPDMGTVPGRYLVWQYQWPLTPIRFLFPNVLSYFSAHVNNILERNILNGYGHDYWINYIYSDRNLIEYANMLKELSEYCSSKHIRLLVVLTPNDYDRSSRKLFDKIIPLLANANIEYLDLYPAVYARLHTFPQRQLWVTLADAHPGPAVTEVYADEVFRFLKSSGVLGQLAVTGKKVRRDLPGKSK